MEQTGTAQLILSQGLLPLHRLSASCCVAMVLHTKEDKLLFSRKP